MRGDGSESCASEGPGAVDMGQWGRPPGPANQHDVLQQLAALAGGEIWIAMLVICVRLGPGMRKKM